MFCITKNIKRKNNLPIYIDQTAWWVYRNEKKWNILLPWQPVFKISCAFLLFILEIGCRLSTRELKVKQSIYSSKLTHDILSKKIILKSSFEFFTWRYFTALSIKCKLTLKLNCWRAHSVVMIHHSINVVKKAVDILKISSLWCLEDLTSRWQLARPLAIF